MTECLCGEKFSKYEWECIPIKREVYDKNGWKQAGVPDYNYLYVCPKCGTVKMVN